MLKKEKLIHFIYIGIILILITILIIQSILFHKKDKKLTQHQIYYNSKCESYKVQNVNLSKGQIVFIGDSITDLYPLDDFYADLDLATYNRGIGGDTTTGVLNRLQVSIFDLAPSKIVLLIGTNDINGNVEDEKILSNYEKILTKIKEKLPSSKIYCVSIIPQNLSLEAYTVIDVEKSTRVIMDINPKIKNLVESYGEVFINLFTLLADNNNMLIEEYSDDGIHLNKAGFEVWTNLIKPYLYN